MANNQHVNKVEYAGQTLVDLTNDTATESDVLNGKTFHLRSGAQGTGNVITHDVYDGLDSTSTSDALSAKQGKVLSDQIAQKSIPITYSNGIDSNNGKALSIYRVGSVVMVNGYVRFINAPAGGSSSTIATITNSIDRPIIPIRSICGLANNPWEPGEFGYITVDNSTGEINVRPKDGNTFKSIYFSISYNTP